MGGGRCDVDATRSRTRGNFPRWVPLIMIPYTTAIIFRASRDVGTPDKVTVLTYRFFVVVWECSYRYCERVRRRMCARHSHSSPEDGFLHEGSFTHPRPPSLGSGGEDWRKISKLILISAAGRPDQDISIVKNLDGENGRTQK